MMRLMVVGIVAALIFAGAGCRSYVSYGDRQVITEHRLDADDLDRRIQAAPVAEIDGVPLPAWIKAWAAEDARAWAAMEAWAKREQPTPAPQPVE